MLQTDFEATVLDPISAMIGRVNGNNFIPEILDQGIILRPDFGGSIFLPGWEQYPKNLSINSIGVCDHHTQIIEQCPELSDPDRIFLIAITPVKKKNQTPQGGWRWHKWGPYIGDKKPQCEYLYDEPEIQEVFVYHIYEK